MSLVEHTEFFSSLQYEIGQQAIRNPYRKLSIKPEQMGKLREPIQTGKHIKVEKVKTGTDFFEFL